MSNLRRNPAHEIRSFWPCLREVVKDCQSVLEVGAGEGHNLRALSVPRRVGLEVHQKYVKEGGGVEFIIGNAIEVLPTLPDKSFDVVMLIDVIEHFFRQDGDLVLAEVERIASKKVIVWTPSGLMIQDHIWHDNYNNREWSEWLEHKSSWSVYDLEQRGYDAAEWTKYHNNYITKQKSIGAIFAVKEIQ